MRKTKLRKFAEQMDAIRQDMTDEVEAVRDDWEDRSEKWQDSDTGLNEDNDISEVEGLVDDLESALSELINVLEP